MPDHTSLKQALAAKPGCLSAQELEKLVADSAATHPHVAECTRCQTELALLKAFESDEPLPDEGAAVAWISTRLEKQLDQIKHPELARARQTSKERISWMDWLFAGAAMRWTVAAAAVLVVAGASYLLMHRSQEPELHAEATNGPVVYRTQEVDVVAPIGEQREAPKTLQWKAFGGAVGYKVSIMEVDEVPLWTGQTSDLTLTIPANVRDKMLPGKPVLWRVAALDNQGRELAVSQVQRFSVQRKSPAPTSGVPK